MSWLQGGKGLLEMMQKLLLNTAVPYFAVSLGLVCKRTCQYKPSIVMLSVTKCFFAVNWLIRYLVWVILYLLILYRPKYLIPSSFLPLISYLLFFLRSFYYVLCRAKDQTPGTREFQSTFFWFKSRKRHLSVKKVLPLKLSCWFLGAVELLQLATLAECLTSSQTILALFPKTNKV